MQEHLDVQSLKIFRGLAYMQSRFAGTWRLSISLNGMQELSEYSQLNVMQELGEYSQLNGMQELLVDMQNLVIFSSMVDMQT
jgi:hypothetical protein